MKYLKLVYNTPQHRANKLIKSDKFSDPLRGEYAAYNTANSQQNHKTVKVNFFHSLCGKAQLIFHCQPPFKKYIALSTHCLIVIFMSSFFFSTAFEFQLTNKNCSWFLSYLVKYFRALSNQWGALILVLGRECTPAPIIVHKVLFPDAPP